jgi:polyisoprenoid-binding protein YceI
MRNPLKWVLIAAAAVVLVAVVAPFVYINFIRDDAPDRFELSDNSTTTSAGDAPADSTAGAMNLDGTWHVTDGSEAGYRATEILFGQDAEAAGRTSEVSGSFEIAGTTVPSASVTVDMASVESDEDLRDNQFRGRIMAVEQFPTATFVLTGPIELEAIPAVNEPVTVSATGDLMLRGTTRPETVDLQAKLLGDGTIEVVGNIPIVWDDYGIPEPSGGPAQVADDGEIEFRLVLAQ